MCDACFLYEIGARPACAYCVREITWAATLAWSQLVVFVLVALGLTFWLSRHVDADLSIGAWIVVALAALGGVFLTRRRARERRAEAEAIVRREPGAVRAGSLETPSHPYRARIARVAAAAVPTVSARTSAFVVGAVLIASAVLLPASLKLPRWIEIEIVLAAWWAMLIVGLAVLLFRGTRFHEDHAFRMRLGVPGISGGDGERSLAHPSRWFDVVTASSLAARRNVDVSTPPSDVEEFGASTSVTGRPSSRATASRSRSRGRASPCRTSAIVSASAEATDA
jgi:hypothetical protein